MAGVTVVNFLAEKLSSAIYEKLKEEVSLVATFKEEFASIYQEIVHIKSILNDAGEQANSESLRNWLQNLREVLTDAMDLVEDCEEADNAYVSNFQHRIFKYPMGRMITSLDKKRREIIFRNQKGRKIKELKKRIDNINGKNSKYLTYLNSFISVKPSSEHKRRISSSLVKNGQIVGKQDDINVITKWLLEEGNPRVIAVWGMGGLGKSTIVRKVFDSEKVQNGFKHRVWLSVSEKFKIDHLLHAIADQIELPEDEFTEVSMERLRTLIVRYIQEKEEVKNVAEDNLPLFNKILWSIKRYFEKPSLFVLDDVWDEDVLQQIGFDLENKNNKIKIVVTTRHKGVSTAMAGDYSRQMTCLSDEESLELFCFHAFPDEKRKLPEHLECFRAEILEKCTRLPKAVQAIAISMAGVSMIDSHWEMALRGLDKADIISKHVIPTLRSSYNALPHHLKACFHYFASFPPNTKIKTRSLVYAWLANFREFLPSGVDAFDEAWSYADQLVDRCVIEVLELGVDGRVKSCQMQEFFHGLALSESNNEAKCLIKSGQGLTDFPVQECKNARRISLAKTHIPTIKDAVQCPGLRILSLCDNTRLISISKSFYDNLKYLAVLDLSNTGIKSLPSSIGNLKRVKFLNLSGTKIENLPKSLSGLRSLMFLDVSLCEELRSLHSGIGGHTLMQYLNVQGCKNLDSLPSGISKLRALQTLRLKGVVFNRKAVANSFGWTGFKEFTDLQYLSVTFDSETSLSEGFLSLQTWPCMGKMRVLMLQYLSSGDECCALPPGLEVMQRVERLHLIRLQLSPPASPFWEHYFRNLKELLLEGDDSYGESSYKGIEKIPNLKILHLIGNKKCFNLPKMFGESKAFPKLEKLIIKDFNNLEEFPSLQDKAMPCLEYLQIKNCRGMRDLPTGLGKLKSLQKIGLDSFLVKWKDYPEIRNASGVTIKYVLERKSYKQIRNKKGKTVDYVVFEEPDESP